MGERSDVIPGVRSFLDDYREKLDSLQEEAEGIFISCYGCTGRRNPEDSFIEVRKTIEALKTLSSIRERLDELRQVRAKSLKEFKHHIKNDQDAETSFEEFGYKIAEIIIHVEQCAKNCSKEAENTYKKINDCRYGEKENSTANALAFQRLVIQLVDWLFVTELERMDLSEIEDGFQLRDAGYRVLPPFDTKERCGFSFQHLFIECKNYKLPDRDDLMQVFSYTLNFQESKSRSMPLSILISRENPKPGSVAWRLRSLLFKRRIEHEERLIIFLDVDDLARMLECKLNSGDPASIIREKIERLNNYNIQHGA